MPPLDLLLKLAGQAQERLRLWQEQGGGRLARPDQELDLDFLARLRWQTVQGRSLLRQAKSVDPQDPVVAKNENPLPGWVGFEARDAQILWQLRLDR